MSSGHTNGTLADYHRKYGFGYEHRVYVHVPAGHNYNDRFNQDIKKLVTEKYKLRIKSVNPDAVTYVSKFTRNPLPEKIIWDLGTRADSRNTKSFYWLQAD